MSQPFIKAMFTDDFPACVLNFRGRAAVCLREVPGGEDVHSASCSSGNKRQQLLSWRSHASMRWGNQHMVPPPHPTRTNIHTHTQARAHKHICKHTHRGEISQFAKKWQHKTRMKEFSSSSSVPWLFTSFLLCLKHLGKEKQINTLLHHSSWSDVYCNELAFFFFSCTA